MTDDLDPVSPFYMRDPYREFLAREGVPVYEEMMSGDLLTLELGPWARLGGRGAYVHIPGRGDFCTCYVAEIPPGGSLAPEQHLADETIYVLSGRGATSIETPAGKMTFEWGTGSLFAIPLNAPHQLFNGSGTEPARFIAVTDLPIALNHHHSEDFVFKNPFVFADRLGDPKYFRGEGELRSVMAGRHQWETNLVPDLRTLDTLQEWSARGAGGRSIQLAMADSTLHTHVSEFPQGTYKKAHRRPLESGVYIICISGHGYSLLWEEGQDPINTLRVDWEPGTLFCNGPGEHYHQHFNTAAHPSRYLVLGFGNVRYPVLEARRRASLGSDKSLKDGGRQIEYEDEDPRVLRLFEEELARRGLQSQMRSLVGAR